MANGTCIAEDCAAESHAKGLCRRHYNQAHHAANLDRAKAAQALNRAAHRDRDRERSAAWRKANPERVRQGNRSYRQLHEAVLRDKRRLYREQNRDLIRALNNRAKAKARGVEVNDLTGPQWRAILNVWDHRCAYCGRSGPMTMDHVIPLAHGGAHTAVNVVPACRPCNRRKGDGPAPPFRTD